MQNVLRYNNQCEVRLTLVYFGFPSLVLLTRGDSLLFFFIFVFFFTKKLFAGKLFRHRYTL
jgi:hypothetical protein